MERTDNASQKILWVSEDEMSERQKKALGTDIEIKQMNKAMITEDALRDETAQNDIIAVAGDTPAALLYQIWETAEDRPVIMAKDRKVEVEFTKEEAEAVNWAIDMMGYYGSTNGFWRFPMDSVRVSEGINKLTPEQADADLDIIGQENYCGAYTWGEKNNPYYYGEAFDKLRTASWQHIAEWEQVDGIETRENGEIIIAKHDYEQEQERGEMPAGGDVGDDRDDR